MNNPFPTNPSHEETKVIRMTDWADNWPELMKFARENNWVLLATSLGRAHFIFISPEALDEE